MIILVILTLLNVDFIKDNAVFNKMNGHENSSENSQKNNRIVKSLPIFIKADLDNSSSPNSQENHTLEDFLKDKDPETFDYKSILPPMN